MYLRAETRDISFIGCRLVVRTGVTFLLGLIFGLYIYSNYDSTQVTNGQSPQSQLQWLMKHHNSKDSSPSTPQFPQLILILAYFRSGSTFTGDILQLHDESMYLYEPLYNIWQNNNSTFADGNTRGYKNRLERVDESRKQLKAWFTCNPLEADLQSIKSRHMTFNFKMRSLATCMRLFAKKNFTIQANQTCILPFIKRCEANKVRIIKTIRLQVEDIIPLLEELPNFKVIHLVRDPRGTLLSRFRVNKEDNINRSNMTFKESALNLCNHIMDNVKTIRFLNTRFPGRIKQIRYEEIATYPVSTMRQLYSFFGLETSDGMIKRVRNMTFSGTHIEHSYDTQRKDSVFTANAWRLRLDMKDIRDIDGQCADMYNVYGYIPISSEVQRTSLLKQRVWIDNLN